jgi:hypothetical protein
MGKSTYLGIDPAHVPQEAFEEDSNGDYMPKDWHYIEDSRWMLDINGTDLYLRMSEYTFRYFPTGSFTDEELNSVVLF